MPSLVTVHLTPLSPGDRTELTLAHAQLPAAQVEPHRSGWATILSHVSR